MNILSDIYKLYVRSVLEIAAPLWAGALTKKNKQDIEAVQIACLKIMMGEKYNTYSQTLQILGLQNLDARRYKLCQKFAKKCAKSPKFKDWFKLKQSAKTRSKEKYLQPKTKTKRFEMSAIPYLTGILNSS